MSSARPLLLCVLRVSDDMGPTSLKSLRFRVANYVQDEGYSLTDIVEVRGTAQRQEAAYEHVEALAGRDELAGILLVGDVQRSRIASLAIAMQLTVHELPPILIPTGLPGDHPSK